MQVSQVAITTEDILHELRNEVAAEPKLAGKVARGEFTVPEYIRATSVPIDSYVYALIRDPEALEVANRLCGLASYEQPAVRAVIYCIADEVREQI